MSDIIKSLRLYVIVYVCVTPNPLAGDDDEDFPPPPPPLDDGSDPLTGRAHPGRGQDQHNRQGRASHVITTNKIISNISNHKKQKYV